MTPLRDKLMKAKEDLDAARPIDPSLLSELNGIQKHINGLRPFVELSGIEFLEIERYVAIRGYTDDWHQKMLIGYSIVDAEDSIKEAEIVKYERFLKWNRELADDHKHQYEFAQSEVEKLEKKLAELKGEQ